MKHLKARFIVLVLVFGSWQLPSLVTAAPLTTLTSLKSSQSQETVLYNFGDFPDARKPIGGLLSGPNGSFYGATIIGGTNGSGTIYQLTPSSVSWNETVLHSFASSGPGASTPGGALVADGAGNLYGATFLGGTYGGGTIYKLALSNGVWTETVLHSFNPSTEGAGPMGRLVMDSQGNLFGVTSYNSGTVFELLFSTHGYTAKILYDFSLSGGRNGRSLVGGLITTAPGVQNPNEPAAALYGAAYSGASPGFSTHGNIFQLVPSSNTWAFKIIYAFGISKSADAANPGTSLSMDAAGNIYGTTVQGIGTGYPNGTVFQLTPSKLPGGAWSEKVLYAFTKQNGDGSNPSSTPILDASGALYGATGFGGNNALCGGSGCGMVYKLTNQGATWTETVLFDFNGANGKMPIDLLLGSNGTIYGPTLYGGTTDGGVVYQLK